MIPQPDLHVLTANPQFALLYKDLATNRLERNGSSRVLDVKAAKEREGFKEVCYLFLSSDLDLQ